MIEDDGLLEKTLCWVKVSADIKKEFDSEPVYNEECLKTKKNSRGDKVTDFYNKKIPKEYLFSTNKLGFCSQYR